MDHREGFSPIHTKSVRFHHQAGQQLTAHDLREHNEWPKNIKSSSSNSLNLLIKDSQGDAGSPMSPITGGKSPRVHEFLHSTNISGYGSENDVSASADEANEGNVRSFHLDYMYTPPLVKGPCCVCGEGIVGAMVTALDKMWHPEHFRCVNCNLELIGPNYLEHSGQPYCKRCHNILFLPPCFGCKKDIEGKYLSELDHIWHHECFTCTACSKPLIPPNYYTRDFKPYCEDDYHRLFSPKCHACKKPIKDNRKVEVLGRQWHPEHFKCCQCGTQLTPHNFREKNGKLYCEHDYNDLFKPKCEGCKKPILQEPIVALSKNWHPECFRCTECKITLNPLKFMEMNGKPYCENDFHKLFSPKCAGCNQPIKNKNNMVQAQGKNWHPEHFCCTECRKQLDPKRFFEKNGLPYCEDDYHRLFSTKCAGCLNPIKEAADGIKAQGKSWHPQHFCCTKCRKPLDPNNFFEMNGLPYCEEDYHKLFSSKCAGCAEPIKDSKKVLHAQGKTWHPEHFCCTKCKKPLDPNRFFEMNGLPYCEEDYHKLFSSKCAGCAEPIKDSKKTLHAQGKTWHPEHFCCGHCRKMLDGNKFYERDQIAYCEDCYHNLFSPRCAGCGQPIKDKYIFAMGKHWHPEHFKCDVCTKKLQEDNYYERDGLAYCVDDYLKLSAPKCHACYKPITTEYCVVALRHDWHPDCFRCKDCNCLLENRDFYEYEGEPYCEEHYHARMCPDCMKLRRAENYFFSIKDDRVARPNSSLLVMTSDFDALSASDSRPGSRLSQGPSSPRLYDSKKDEEPVHRPFPIEHTRVVTENRFHEEGWKPVPIANQQTSINSNYSTLRSTASNGDHWHGHDGGSYCSDNNEYERRMMSDARLRNYSGNSQASSSTVTGAAGAPVPFVSLNPMKTKHDHKHEQYFESGVIPGKFPAEGDNMKFQTAVRKDQFQTISRNY